ncbi:MAG: TlpA family protein disulfide reductase [Alistipes sp.]|nr:TlpA family protein disulfide reductase [Alistipes sp.]
MLVLLIVLVVVIIKWPFASAAEEVVEQVATTEQVAAEPEANVEPAAEQQKSADDDVEATTLINVGDMAPDFTVTMLDGREYTLSELRGNVVMVCFWATWCPPCRQELAHLQEGVIDHFAGEKLVVLPISRGEQREVVEKFITDMGYTFGVGLDSDRAIYDLYASNYIPRTFIVNKQGKVVYRNAGYDETIAQEVNAAITKALK